MYFIALDSDFIQNSNSIAHLDQGQSSFFETDTLASTEDITFEDLPIKAGKIFAKV